MRKILKLILYLAALAVLLLLLAIFSLVFINKKINESKSSSGGENIIFEVLTGQNAKEIALNLQESGLISSDSFLLVYLWQTGNSDRLQAGKYSLNVSNTIKEIADKMIRGDVIKNEISVTIPEGFRLKEIEERLAGKNIIQKGALQTSLEGYLFPDTYNFSANKLPLEVDYIVKKFLDNFDKKTADLKMEAKKQNTNFNDIVIVASILEKEVRTQEDMKIVSGILWKRIDIGMPLQVDATIAYITSKKTGEITYDDLKIDSPYNTYTNKGLPPSPISNPGLVALDAALNYVKSDYLYYLSKPTGETVFSETLEKHNRAKKMYLE